MKSTRTDEEYTKAVLTTLNSIAREPSLQGAGFMFACNLALHGVATNDDAFKEWKPSIMHRLEVGRCRYASEWFCRDGSWDPIQHSDKSKGRLLTTVYNTLSLEMIYRYPEIYLADNK
jgi:hypothetical protein